MDTEQNAKRSISMSFKDVLIDYGFHGIDKVKEAARDGRVSLAVLQRAVDEIAKDETIDGTELAAWVASVTPKPSGKGPGRGAMEPNTLRNYKVQEVKGSVFLRLPALGLSKGMTVPVEFSADRSKLVVHLAQAKPAVVKE